MGFTTLTQEIIRNGPLCGLNASTALFATVRKKPLHILVSVVAKSMCRWVYGAASFNAQGMACMTDILCGNLCNDNQKNVSIFFSRLGACLIMNNFKTVNGIYDA